MAQFSVKKNNIDSVINAEGKLANELSSIQSEIRSIGNSLGFELAAKANIRNRLNSAANSVSAHRTAMNHMRSALQNTVNAYERTENTILGNLNAGETEDANWKKTALDWLWKGAGAFGPVGGLAKAVGKVVTGDESPAATWADFFSDMWDAGWDIGDTVKQCKGKTGVDWLKAGLGLEADDFLKSISKSNLDWTQRAAHGWDKGIKGTLREFKTKAGLAKQGVGIGLSLFSNGIGNYEEYKTGAITAKRAVAETITETAVDWGKDLLIGAAVTAGFAAAGFAAPVFVVGLATVAVSAGADWVCEKVTGKKVTEAVSDFVLDTAESGWDLVKTGAKKVSEGTSALWSNVKQGLSSLNSSGWKFGFA